MQQVSPGNSRMEKFTGGCMKAVAAVLFCILFYLFFHGFFVTDQADFFVIQSEAKDLECIHFRLRCVTEILRFVFAFALNDNYLKTS